MKLQIMNNILISETTAWRVGAVLLCSLSAFAYSLIGWVGVGTVGLLGLVISTNFNLHSGPALADRDFESGDVPLYARQLEEVQKSRSSPEQKAAATALLAKRSRVLYLINTVFISIMALGFGLSILHQL
jgi:hypothetical protein